jgi:hypothetical protein
MKLQYVTSTLSAIALLLSSGWSSVYAVTFTPPDKNDAPSQATGGASRGTNLFIPPLNSAPSQTTGGASRGTNLFTPPPNSAPNQTTGGASRGNDLFTPPPNSSTPSQTTGGASRLGSYNVNPVLKAAGPAALIALLPQNYYGRTLEPKPTIMVYLPASNAKEAIFTIKHQDGSLYYTMSINVANNHGILPIKLPEDGPALAIGENYHWVIAVNVNGKLTPSTPYVDGWIQRVMPDDDLQAAMKQSDTLKLITVLGNKGIWYDCLAKLGGLYSAQPKNADLNKQWEELLSSVNLNVLAQAPFVNFTSQKS